jgi:hypothetical protein
MFGIWILFLKRKKRIKGKAFPSPWMDRTARALPRQLTFDVL